MPYTDPDTGEIDLFGDAVLPESTEGPLRGEIISSETHPSYADLDAAESAFYDTLDAGESLRISQMRILDAIRGQELYRQKTRPKTGLPYGSMEEYVGDLIKSTAAFSGEAPRTLKSWMTRWEIFVKQLDWQPQDLLDMGAHAEVMLPVAARSRTTLALSPANEPLEGGEGKRLGQEEFTRFAEEIRTRVREKQANPGVDELSWKVSDTKERVKEILGTTTEKSHLEVNASWKGTARVSLDAVVFWVGDGDTARQYKIGDTMPVADFQKLFGSAQVNGLGEDWKQ